MTQDAEPVFLAQGPFGRLDEMRRLLARAGVDAAIVRPPDAKANA